MVTGSQQLAAWPGLQINGINGGELPAAATVWESEACTEQSLPTGTHSSQHKRSVHCHCRGQWKHGLMAFVSVSLPHSAALTSQFHRINRPLFKNASYALNVNPRTTRGFFLCILRLLDHFSQLQTSKPAPFTSLGRGTILSIWLERTAV